MSYLKPQYPLSNANGSFYPLTTADQVLLSDGTRLEKGGRVVADVSSNSEMLGGKAPGYYLSPRNLLDNSDFRNPVNQRGKTSYIGIGYTIDRWRTWADNAVVNINSGYISHDGVLMQYINGANKDIPHTFVVCDDNNVLHIVSGIPSNSPINAEELAMGYEQGYDAVYVSIPGAIWGMKWAALYEGSYTADNLPPYVPKGYAVELAECQRYYWQTVTQDPLMRFKNSAAQNVLLWESTDYVWFPMPMRNIPNVQIAYDLDDSGEVVATPRLCSDFGCTMPDVELNTNQKFDLHWIKATADL